MRTLQFATLAVVFIATVTGKISFGPCRTDVPQLTYDDYTAEREYDHRLFALDKDFFYMASILENLGFKFPLEDWRCDDLVTGSPFMEYAEEQETDNFYLEEEQFELWFPDREDAVLKYVKDVDEDVRHIDVIYLCVDPFSMPALIEQTRAFGLEASDSAISFQESLNSFFSIFKKLNLALRI